LKKILILFQLGSEVRQFGHSGFIAGVIERGWKVTVATRFPEAEFCDQLDARAQVVPLPKAPHSFWYEQLAVTLDRAQSLRRQKAGNSTWSYGKPVARNIRQRARLRVIAALSGAFARFPALFTIARRLESALIHMQGRKAYGDFLRLHNPDAVVVSVPRLNYQAHLLAAAEEQGISSFLFYHTNKDVVALSRLDHHYSAIGVWNDWMKSNLLLQNPGLTEQSVHVTGCAHFDCIAPGRSLNGEIEFRTRFGLRSEEKVVLYTAAAPASVPEEERFIELVLDAMAALPDISTRLVVRLNPMDDSTRLEEYLGSRHPDVIVLRPDWHYSRGRNLCFQKKEDVSAWNELLHYAAVCINIPSTVTVECALAGLPVINIGFDLPGPRPLPGSIRDFWNVDYYLNVRKTRAALLCENAAQLKNLLNDCLDRRTIVRHEQRDLLDLELNGILPPCAHEQYMDAVECSWREKMN
jgi:hypothetical protein